MEITDVRVKLSSGGQPRLLAYCTITFDGVFVVRDIKVIQGNDGPFVAMPSRRPTQRCHNCKTRNPVKSRFCGECGRKRLYGKGRAFGRRCACAHQYRSRAVGKQRVRQQAVGFFAKLHMKRAKFKADH